MVKTEKGKVRKMQGFIKKESCSTKECNACQMQIHHTRTIIARLIYNKTIIIMMMMLKMI